MMSTRTPVNFHLPSHNSHPMFDRRHKLAEAKQV